MKMDSLKTNDSAISSQVVTDLPAADSLQSSLKNAVLTLTSNRPDKLNALDLEMAKALRQQLIIAAEDTTVRVVVITGHGRGFCAGGDLKFAMQANPEQPGNSFQALTSVLHECIEVIRAMAKPVIAAINGPDAGAGMFLALACDLRLISQSACLKVSNTTYGLSLPAGGTFLLPRLLGIGRALDLAMLDQPVSAEAAQSMGLVTQVIADQYFHDEVATFAGDLSKKSVKTLGQVKLLMNESFGCTLSEQLSAEQQAIVKSANHPEGREGLDAFLQKRQPEFIHLN
jgi:2-(1,2-epoxy-1,2-dihydrophenyl)acetyl-CoA isomerase